jgi:putative copper resistance protein D
MLFLPLVLLPSRKNHPDRMHLLYTTGMRLRTVGWITLIGLVFTGVLNLHFRHIPFEWSFYHDSQYGHWLLIKLILFGSMLIIGAYHDFYIGKRALEDLERQPDPKLRKIASWTGRINLLLALAIAFIGIGLSRGFF